MMDKQMSSTSEKSSFEFSTSIKDFLAMLITVGFGIWIFIEFPGARFGGTSVMAGAFMVVGGLSYLVKFPFKGRRAGTLLALLGSFVAMYVCYSATMLILEMVYYPFSYEIGLLSILVSFLCFMVSLAQFCKSM